MRGEILVAAMALVVVLAPAPALGGEARVALDVNGGGLTASGPDRVELPPVRLDGRPETVEARVGPFEVFDSRPGAPGWSLVARAARPADALGRPMGAPLVLVPESVPAEVAPAASAAGALDTPRALMRAPEGTGTGVFAARPVLRLTVPPDTPSGRYVATLVVTIS